MFFDPLLTNDDVCYVMMSNVAMLTMLWLQIWGLDILKKFLMLFYPLFTKMVCDVTYHFGYDMYMTSHAMTSGFRYDELRFVWYVYDNNTEPCNRWIGTRAGGHGPAVPLPPGSWSVGPVAAADAANSGGWVRSARAMWLRLKQTSNKTTYRASGGGGCGQ